MTAFNARATIASTGAVEFYLLRPDVERPEGLADTAALAEGGLAVVGQTTGEVEILLVDQHGPSPVALAEYLLRRLREVSPRLFVGLTQLQVTVEDAAAAERGRTPGPVTLRTTI